MCVLLRYATNVPPVYSRSTVMFVVAWAAGSRMVSLLWPGVQATSYC